MRVRISPSSRACCPSEPILPAAHQHAQSFNSWHGPVDIQAMVSSHWELPAFHYRGEGLCKLEFLHFKFCTKILYATCSVFSRICAGNNSKRPLFLMSNYWEPHIICSLIFKKWHRFCRARICGFIFSPARNPPPPPVSSLLAPPCRVPTPLAG